jgi:hypothetical protein
MSVYESGMYERMGARPHRRGDLLLLVQSWPRAVKYLSCVLVGVPIWYVIGILITFSPEISRELGVQGVVVAGRSVMFCYIGLIFGDLSSGLISQWMRSRKRAIGLFLVLTTLSMLGFLFSRGHSEGAFYALCVMLGFSTGYWAMFVTVASEQFGTVTTTAPNFVRGSVVPLTMAFQALRGEMSLARSALIVGLVSMTIAFLSLWRLKETFGKDLDYFEERHGQV